METLSQQMLSIHDKINCHHETVEILLLQEQEYATIYSTISIKPGCEETNTLSYLPVYKEKKKISECLVKVVFEAQIKLREETVDVGINCRP